MRRSPSLALGVLLAVLTAVEARTPPRAGVSHFLTTSDGVRLHYLEAGAIENPTLLLIPGWTVPAEIFAPQLAGLAGDFRVVALDPRAQGDSAKPAGGHTPARRADDIADLLDHLGVRDAIIAGWSLGVPEVLTYIDRHGTARLRGVVLIDGIVGIDPVPGATNPFDVTDAALADMLSRMQKEGAAFANEMARGLFRTRQPESYLAGVAEGLSRTPTSTAAAILRNYAKVGDWRPVLQAVDRPILYAITGSLAPHGDTVRRIKPAARIEVFSTAGHALFVDEPARFNGLIRDFAAATDRAARR